MTKPAKNPQKLTVAQYITHQLLVSKRSQVEVANEAGFEQKNMISMLKSGTTKLATSRIPALARALRVDPKELFMICMEEYTPEIIDVLMDINGQPPLTSDEVNLMDVIRAARPTRANNKLSHDEQQALYKFIYDLPSSVEARRIKAEMDKQDENDRLAKESKKATKDAEKSK